MHLREAETEEWIGCWVWHDGAESFHAQFSGLFKTYAKVCYASTEHFSHKKRCSKKTLLQC